ncbi:twin-arginine translocase TatA/TatE family subunit [Streptomyces sp. SID4919]|uniref:Sec-independent protein translocase protein TatA n=1 Tax=Streptomyces uncialis TaxID=1048205 RepID=A0A1Q4V462_9ACTN|nr:MULTISPECIES: Sec-independent protein translocase subunit TatA [Streptomyces]MYY12792.1 twin-arginine translocase TatA/TatE family subunit [Streptomyces sp. SID4919]OKH92635.1 preprotein translocase subunit TatA [Streptomyces uncialis]WST71305.1 Sec-independent protein translocase subunit TatA [Streptomyces uncialis]WTE10030.1 Sec-independent protein translocase subunit TatA [Streptomyces uncialis]SCK61593.1 sec-independent protein translocase protein TatA [Streptomyces sp. AmelKG-E11A]
MFGGRIGPLEITLILVIILLLFGAKKLPDMARSLGKSARILKSEAKAMKSEGEQPAPAEPANKEQPVTAPRTIQAAPGDVTSSRPVNEPTDTTQR